MNAEHFHELGGSYRVSVTNTSTQQALHHDCRRVRLQCTHSNMTFEVGANPTATTSSHFLCPRTGGVEVNVPPNSKIAVRTVIGGVGDDDDDDNGNDYLYITELRLL